MIVCSCNVLSDADVRTALNAADTPRTAGQVYGCLGCSPQCGRCARTIKRIMNEALAACAPATGEPQADQAETCEAETCEAETCEAETCEAETCGVETCGVETCEVEIAPATPCGPHCKCCSDGQHRD